MPVTTSYPGLYIEELPSTVHTITAAPTSVTVFIGYTHPFKTQQFDTAVEIFNFGDYQAAFGGLYENDHVDSHVAFAVQQFFLNGGADAYVVGLDPKLPQPSTVSGQIQFTGLEPVDAAHAIAITINVSKTDVSVADIEIAYAGSIAETYRKVSLSPTLGSPPEPNPNYIETRINGVSALVTVSQAATGSPPSALGPGQSYGAAYSTSGVSPMTSLGVGDTPVFNVTDFNDVFVDDGSLDKVPIFNILLIPGVTQAGIWAEAIAFCEKKRAFMIMDAPYNDAADSISTKLRPVQTDVDLLPKSINAALYFPYLTSDDPLTGKVRHLPPSGYVAGIYSRIDNTRGVWKAPAGLEASLNNATGVVPWGQLTDARAGVLNPLGVNCIRTFSGSGTVVFGARTTTTKNTALVQWRYVPVRRTALFLEQTLLANLGWVVFEPNDEPLWTSIKTSITAFMLTLFHQGAFQGSTPSDAFLVKCDKTTTTQTDIDNGIVNILVAFAPLKPAEFVVIQIAQLAGQAQS